MSYLDLIEQTRQTIGAKQEWSAINAEYAVRMQLQNRFKTGLEIAQYTADIMRRDMANYDADSSKYTQSLGCWHGFVAQQVMMSVKKHQQTTDRSYIYLSGWMVAALRSQFGPLPDQSMHEKTSVSDLIEEIYTFLKQADARELRHMFVELDEARANGGDADSIIQRIDSYETHVVPIIADIDAGFGNEEATYLLAKRMIEAGACAIQIENQVSDAKQCGHQAGKVTVPHEDFVSKINAVRYAFLELGIDNGIIVARTDSLGAGLTQKVPVSIQAGDLGSKYNDFLDTEVIEDVSELQDGDITIRANGKLAKPKRLDNGLYAFKEDTDASPEMNLISLHPALIKLAEDLLGCEEIHLYQSHTWAKFTGEADYDQPFHCDYGNHTLTVPAENSSDKTVNFVIYISDVTDPLGAMHYVRRADSDRILGPEAIMAPADKQQALQAETRSAAAPAGSLVAYCIDTFHRGTNMIEPNGLRYTMTVSFKRADNANIGFHVWQHAVDRPWHHVINHASPEQLGCLGIPSPGDSFWTQRTLEQCQTRWPNWDLAAYRAAVKAPG